MPGYSIESNNTVLPIKQQLTEKINIVHSQTVPSIQTVSLPIAPKIESPVIPSTSVAVNTFSNNIKRKLILKDLVSRVNVGGDSLSNRKIKEKQVDGRSKVSFWTGVSLFLLPMAMIPLGYDVFYPAGASDYTLGAYIGFGFLVWFILAIISFTSGITAVKEIKKHSDTLTGSGEATVGIVLSSIVLAFFALVLIVGIVAFL